jgi:hypothetical protein
VTLIDAFALPGAGLTWRPDERAHLGASVGRGRRGGRRLTSTRSSSRTRRSTGRRTATTCWPRCSEALAGRAPIVLADCYQSGQHYVETADGAVLAAYPEVAAYVKYEAEVTVPAIWRRWARGRAARDPPRRAPRRSTRSPAGLGPVDLAARDRFCAASSRGLGRGRGRSRSTAARCRCDLARLPVHLRALQLQPRARPGEPKLQRRLAADRLAPARRAGRDPRRDPAGHPRRAGQRQRRHFDHLLAALADLGVAFDLPNGLRADYLEARHLARMRGRVTTVSVSAESGAQRVVDRGGRQAPRPERASARSPPTPPGPACRSWSTT